MDDQGLVTMRAASSTFTVVRGTEKPFEGETVLNQSVD